MLAALILLLTIATASADMLDYVTPRGGSVGTAVEVLLHGNSLENPKEILFYNDCIKASEVAPGAKPRYFSTPNRRYDCSKRKNAGTAIRLN